MRQIPGWVAGAMLAVARAAEAHPGHGDGGGSYSLQHYMVEPAHGVLRAAVLGGLLLVSGCLLAWRWRQGAAARRPGGRVL